jgi:hypothetical protein
VLDVDVRMVPLAVLELLVNQIEDAEYDPHESSNPNCGPQSAVQNRRHQLVTRGRIDQADYNHQRQRVPDLGNLGEEDGNHRAKEKRSAALIIEEKRAFGGELRRVDDVPACMYCCVTTSYLRRRIAARWWLVFGWAVVLFFSFKVNGSTPRIVDGQNV